MDGNHLARRIEGHAERTSHVVGALASEILDRYGPLPTPVLQLLEYARLRLLAEKIRVVSIERDAGLLAFRFDPESPVDPVKLVNLTSRFPDAQLTPGGLLKLPVTGFEAPELLTTVREVLLELSS